MSSHLDKSWVVLASLQTADGTRCVDLFRGPDGTFGFEEFRKDSEDRGAWTPLHGYAAASYSSQDEAMAAARRNVSWLDGCNSDLQKSCN